MRSRPRGLGGVGQPGVPPIREQLATAAPQAAASAATRVKYFARGVALRDYAEVSFSQATHDLSSFVPRMAGAYGGLVVNNMKKGVSMLRTAFWQTAAQSLPPLVRGRHAKDLERAERVERVVVAIVDLLRATPRAGKRRGGAFA
jgi:hypothetical protein